MEFIYTPQQLAGYKGYQRRVKVGNWSEDLELEQVKLQDFLFKKENGLLKCTQQEQRFAHALQETAVYSKHDDGYVHFGDIVMVFNQATDGCLSSDLDEKLTDETFAAQTTWYTEPCARTTFEIVRYEGKGDKRDAIFDYGDDILHFSQKFRLRCHATLTERDIFLMSQPKTPNSFARYSRQQEVCLTTGRGWNTVWECVCLDPQFRLEMEGQPIMSNAPMAVLHCQTNQFLASDKIKYYNEFGSEYELFCKNYLDGQRGQLGTRDRRGLGEQNRWCFVNKMPNAEELAGGGTGAPAPAPAPAYEGEERRGEEEEAAQYR
jgi:hypothetical protein